MSRIHIIDGPATATSLQAAIAASCSAETTVAEDGRALSGALAEARPDVLVLGPSLDTEEAFEAAASASSADVPVVLVVKRPTVGLMRRAMRAGVSDVVPASEEDELRAAVGAALARVASRTEPGADVREAPRREGKVVTVFSTKGGVGKSTLATNLGAAIAKTGARAVLVDLDLAFGDVGIMLQVAPTRTIHDAVQVFDRLDEEMLGGFLTRHGSGLSTLLAPVRPEEAESVTSDHVAAVLGMLRRTHDYVVVDTPAALDDVVLTALDASDEVVVVATMDVPSIKNTKIALQKLDQLGYDRSAVRLVLNRADSKVWLQPADIERSVDERISVRIPSDRLVPRSVNKGVPIVLDQPRSAVARRIIALAAEIASGPVGEEAEGVA